MQITTVGQDRSKSVFQVMPLMRLEMLLCANTPAIAGSAFTRATPCLIGIEAGGTSHHWARELTEVRSALFLAANTIMNGRGQPSSLRSFGARLARKKGRKRALVAMARKLAVVPMPCGPMAPCFCNVEKEALA
jgi:transposase